jgi:hypothetical protein
MKRKVIGLFFLLNLKEQIESQRTKVVISAVLARFLNSNGFNFDVHVVGVYCACNSR